MLSRAIWALFFKHSDEKIGYKNIVDPILGGRAPVAPPSPWIRHCKNVPIDASQTSPLYTLFTFYFSFCDDFYFLEYEWLLKECNMAPT